MPEPKSRLLIDGTWYAPRGTVELGALGLRELYEPEVDDPIRRRPPLLIRRPEWPAGPRNPAINLRLSRLPAPGAAGRPPRWRLPVEALTCHEALADGVNVPVDVYRQESRGLVPLRARLEQLGKSTPTEAFALLTKAARALDELRALREQAGIREDAPAWLLLPPGLAVTGDGQIVLTDAELVPEAELRESPSPFAEWFGTEHARGRCPARDFSRVQARGLIRLLEQSLPPSAMPRSWTDRLKTEAFDLDLAGLVRLLGVEEAPPDRAMVRPPDASRWRRRAVGAGLVLLAAALIGALLLRQAGCGSVAAGSVAEPPRHAVIVPAGAAHGARLVQALREEFPEVRIYEVRCTVTRAELLRQALAEATEKAGAPGPIWAALEELDSRGIRFAGFDPRTADPAAGVAAVVAAGGIYTVGAEGGTAHALSEPGGLDAAGHGASGASGAASLMSLREAVVDYNAARQAVEAAGDGCALLVTLGPGGAEKLDAPRWAEKLAPRPPTPMFDAPQATPDLGAGELARYRITLQAPAAWRQVGHRDRGRADLAALPDDLRQRLRWRDFERGVPIAWSQIGLGRGKPVSSFEVAIRQSDRVAVFRDQILYIAGSESEARQVAEAYLADGLGLADPARFVAATQDGGQSTAVIQYVAIAQHVINQNVEPRGDLVILDRAEFEAVRAEDDGALNLE